MELDILTDIVIILGLSVLVIYLFQRLKLPTVLGFLLTGIIAGPYGLSWIKGVHEVEIMAEIGIILLLFVIGVEFSLKSLAAIKKSVLLGGGLQVFLTILSTAVVFFLLDMPLNKSIFIGFLVSLSSTAVLLKLLQDKGEITSPHGKTILAILIFQDIIVVPMMLFTPILAGQTDNVGAAVLSIAVKGILVILGVILLARYGIPFVLYRIAKTRNNELFFISIIVICFSVAWLTSSLGLSLSLGAFMAGLTISESEYSHQAMSYVTPLKEIFTSFFFVSVGMLLDLSFVADNIITIGYLTLGVLVLKSLIGLFAAKSLGLHIRTALMISFFITQIGEFSLILAKEGLSVNIISLEIYQYFLAITILSIAVTPFIINFSYRLSDRISKRAGNIINDLQQKTAKDLEDHIIIVGFGLNGRNIARVAKKFEIPYVILEINPDTVKKEKDKEPIHFGDAMQVHVLQHLNIHKARVVVIAISDPRSTSKIVNTIREQSRTVHVIVRTRFVQDTPELLKLGADEVIPEEFETSIEIFHRVLTHYLVPESEIDSCTQHIRSDNYLMLRSSSVASEASRKLDLQVSDYDIATLPVHSPSSKIKNKTLAEINPRQVFGINLMAIKRDDKMIYDIGPDSKIKVDDMLYVLGKPSDIRIFAEKVGL